MCTTGPQWESAVWLRELRVGLCNHLEAWEGVGGSFKREGIYVYLRVIHVAVWQKPAQYWKAIILQLKINIFKKERKVLSYLGMKLTRR